MLLSVNLLICQHAVFHLVLNNLFQYVGDLSNQILMNFFQYVDDNLSLMSVGFLLSKADEAVIWRGPKKNGTIPIYYFIELPWVHIHVPCSSRQGLFHD